MIFLGVPPKSTELDASFLVGKRRRLAGSMIGGIKEINAAYERMLRGDVKYRFVIDMASLK